MSQHTQTHTYIHARARVCVCMFVCVWTQSAGAVEYTDFISADRSDSPNECPGKAAKQSDNEARIMQTLWEMQNTPSLSPLPGPLWLGVVALNRVLSMGQIELFHI